jgi:hypothetical protein
MDSPVGRRAPLLHRGPASPQTSSGILRLTLALYLAIMSLDALRKTMGLPGSSVAVIYALTTAIYVVALMRQQRQHGVLPRFLPLALLFLTIWCVFNAIIERIPPQFALLGWSSYVFFVPLAYIGAELAADDRRVIRILRVATIIGTLVGIGTILSAILGPAAPVLLQPIIPSVGVHTANGGNIYLAPSIFADSEEACEQLLVALFAWTALMLAGSDSVRRGRFAILGLIIFAGIIAAERRAGIYIAVVGLIVLLAVGTIRPQSTLNRRRLPVLTGGGRWQLIMALGMAAIGSFVLIDILGANLILPFLTSSSLEAPLRLMVASAHPAALAGQGTGTSTQGSYILGATSFSGANTQGPYTGVSMDGRSFVTAEGGLAKTWLELGLVGIILYGTVFMTIIGPAARFFSRLDSIGRALLALTIGLGILFLKGHQSLDDPLIQPLFWIAAGGIWGRLQRPPGAAAHRRLLSHVSPVPDRTPLSASTAVRR